MRYALLISLLLAGCSTSDPIRVGDNRYMIATTNYTGLSTRAGQIQRVMDDANEFCARKGKIAQLESDHSQGQPAASPVSENVVFTCVTGAPWSPQGLRVCSYFVPAAVLEWRKRIRQR